MKSQAQRAACGWSALGSFLLCDMRPGYLSVGLFALSPLPSGRSLAREVLSIERQARTQTCPRRHHFSERCKPLRQPPAERSFSLIPPKWNPVRNDRVLPHLEPLLIPLRYSDLIISLPETRDLIHLSFQQIVKLTNPTLRVKR